MKPHRVSPVCARALAGLAAACLITAAAGVQAQSTAQRERLERQAESLQRELDRQRASDEALQEDLRRRGDAQDRRLETLKRELQECGRCARRARIEAEIAQIEEGRRQTLRQSCAQLKQLEAINPAAVQLAVGMAGLREACAGAAAPATPDGKQPRRETAAEHRQRLDTEARSGDPEALFKRAQWLQKVEDDQPGACRLYAEAASKGHKPSIEWQASHCRQR